MTGHGVSQSDEYVYKNAKSTVQAVKDSLTDMLRRLDGLGADVTGQSAGDWVGGFNQGFDSTVQALVMLQSDAQEMWNKFDTSEKIHHETVALSTEKKSPIYTGLNQTQGRPQ